MLPAGLLPKIWILAGVLSLQGVALYSVKLEEVIPPLPNFASLPETLGEWNLAGQAELDAATRELLKPDYSLIRQYRDRRDGVTGTLFLGYFNTTQANHPNPHSPTVCLPGAGWKEVYSREIQLPDGEGSNFPLNEYVLEKAGQKLIVLYWYQNTHRSWANAVMSKVYILPDFIRDRRTDVALVRITIESNRPDHGSVVEKAKDLATQAYPAIRKQFAASGST